MREWLRNQAAGGYVDLRPGDATRYTLPAEQALALADEDSPFYILGAYELDRLAATPTRTRSSRRSAPATGMGWHEHDHRLFRGTERFFRPGYRAHLVAEWIPALDGVSGEARARREGRRRRLRPRRLDDHHGRRRSRTREFFGFDYHERVDRARARGGRRRPASATGSTFEVAVGQGLPGHRTTTSSACSTACTTWATRSAPSAHVRETLAAGRHLDDRRAVSPATRVEDNLNPVGRVFYGASTVICTPASLSQEVGLALGAQAGEARLAAVLNEGGFTRVRRATETPFNLVLEARP